MVTNMKCANHINADASAVCVNCGTALCRECSIQSDNGRIVCSDKCRQQAEAYINTYRHVQTKMNKQNTVCIYMLLVVGNIELVMALVAAYSDIWPLSIFCASLGICLVLGGLYIRQPVLKT